MKRLLAIETSSEACSVALAINGQVTERFVHAPRKHAELILPSVRAILTDAGLKLAQLDAIAFGRGPGSFTSLRIGIGVVQGLAWGANLPVVAISSLAALAQAVATQDHNRVLVAVDARMNEVYSCSYELDAGGIVQPLEDEQVCPPARITMVNPSTCTGAGNGFASYPELETLGREMEQVHSDAWPGAAAVCHLASHWLESHQPLPADQAQPVYIRNKVAEKPLRT